MVDIYQEKSFPPLPSVLFYIPISTITDSASRSESWVELRENRKLKSQRYCSQRLLRLGTCQRGKKEKDQMFGAMVDFMKKLTLRVTSWLPYDSQHLKMLVLFSLLGSHYWDDIWEFCTKVLAMGFSRLHCSKRLWKPRLSYGLIYRGLIHLWEVLLCLKENE